MNYHLIGIKGSGMCALAQILKDQGHNVTGSDIENKYFTDDILDRAGIKYLPFSETNITSEIDEVIIGNAFDETNVEVVKAMELGLKQYRYFEKLSTLVAETKIAIAGTNGKTTTTGLCASMFADQKLSYLIGDGTGFSKETTADYFIFEACEYKNTFFNYHPEIGLINNVELDHPDFFKTLEQMIESFQTFANNCQKIVVNGDDQNAMKLTHPNKIIFGIENESAHINAKNVEYLPTGIKFDLIIDNNLIGEKCLPFYGEHMLYNSLAAIGIAYACGLEYDRAIENLMLFHGVNRRFFEEVLDKENGIVLIDDYAHHPTAIELTINAVRQKYPDSIVTVLFQPHTYSRTAKFMEEFAESLVLADRIFLCPIFGSVRETEQTVTIDDLGDAIEKHGVNLERDLTFIETIKKNHVICMLGAGDIDKLYRPQIKELLWW
ncbi:MAG: UDP-N-acetylmuramate--L-alanine ligase [Mycoplasmatales bacterium]